MLVDINGVGHLVKFKHTVYDEPRLIRRGKCVIAMTLCNIKNENGFLAGFGIAWCSADDQFKRATGRKIALTRALAKFPREVRRLFWAEYWKRHRR